MMLQPLDRLEHRLTRDHYEVMMSVPGTVYVLDNDSPDDTVEAARRAGASVVEVYATKYYDDDLRVQKQNEHIRRITEHEKLPNLWWMVLDADEHYTHADQREINRLCQMAPEACVGILLQQRHIWRPPSVADRQPLFAQEVVGGYWGVPHCRLWRWVPGMRYKDNHNIPDRLDGTSMTGGMAKVFGPTRPQCIHLGFASSLQSRAAKHRYYVARGEGRFDGRRRYVAARQMWEEWTPTHRRLPPGAEVRTYHGPVPEVFQEEKR